MEYTVTELLETPPEALRHFFMTFGFVHVKAAIPRGRIRMLYTDWEQIFEAVYGVPYDRIRRELKTKVLFPVQRFVPHMLTLLREFGLFDLIVRMLGPRCAFYNQDCSLFFTSSGWHRDVATIMPQVKVNIYLNDRKPDGTGDFMYWPGTHLLGDVYAQMAGSYCSWPDSGAGIAVNRLPARSGMVPHLTAAVMPGDVIIFDDRLVHATAAGDSPWLPYERRLLATSFYANPLDYSDEYFAARGVTREGALQELFDHTAKAEVPKNGPIYPPDFFNDPELAFLAPHLELLRPYAVTATEIVGADGVFAGVRDLLSQNLRRHTPRVLYG